MISHDDWRCTTRKNRILLRVCVCERVCDRRAAVCSRKIVSVFPRARRCTTQSIGVNRPNTRHQRKMMMMTMMMSRDRSIPINSNNANRAQTQTHKVKRRDEYELWKRSGHEVDVVRWRNTFNERSPQSRLPFFGPRKFLLWFHRKYRIRFMHSVRWQNVINEIVMMCDINICQVGRAPIYIILHLYFGKIIVFLPLELFSSYCRLFVSNFRYFQFPFAVIVVCYSIWLKCNWRRKDVLTAIYVQWRALDNCADTNKMKINIVAVACFRYRSDKAIAI